MHRSCILVTASSLLKRRIGRFFRPGQKGYHPSIHAHYGITFGGFMHPRPLMLPILERLPFCQRNAIIRLQAGRQPETIEGGDLHMNSEASRFSTN